MERVHHAAGPEDLAFHLSIYDASHNPLFGQLLSQMRGAFFSFWAKPFPAPISPAGRFPSTGPSSRRSPPAILAAVEEDIV